LRHKCTPIILIGKHCNKGIPVLLHGLSETSSCGFLTGPEIQGVLLPYMCLAVMSIRKGAHMTGAHLRRLKISHVLAVTYTVAAAAVSCADFTLELYMRERVLPW
jgi:hypothetical protein